MAKPITSSSLSEAQRRLVHLLQKVNFGKIEGLQIRSGDPVFEPPPRIVQKLKMGGDNGPRAEAELPDFWLKRPTVEGQAVSNLEVEHRMGQSGGLNRV